MQQQSHDENVQQLFKDRKGQLYFAFYKKNRHSHCKHGKQPQEVQHIEDVLQHNM